jgi:hypothetical protein
MVSAIVSPVYKPSVAIGLVASVGAVVAAALCDAAHLKEFSNRTIRFVNAVLSIEKPTKPVQLLVDGL